MRPVRYFAPIVLCSLLANSPSTAACDVVCGAVDERAANADVIFVGRLVAQDPDSDGGPGPTYRRMNLDVIEVYRGVNGTHVGLWTEVGGSYAGCGFFGATDEVHLVYARRLDDVDRVVIQPCSPPDSNEGFDADLAAFPDLGLTPLAVSPGSDSANPPHLMLAQDPRMCGSGVLGAIALAPLLFAGRRVRQAHTRGLQ